jgi:hypothetical protein
MNLTYIEPFPSLKTRGALSPLSLTSAHAKDDFIFSNKIKSITVFN